MTLLKLGSEGPEVSALQQALEDRQFDPGQIDGDFGSQTESAVRAFQTNAGLDVDGTVGPETAASLKLPEPPSSPDVTAKVTAAMVSRMFPDTPIDNIAANLPLLLNELRAVALGDKTMILMALGTIRAETASFEPIPEGQSEFNTSPGGHPFDLYDDREDLGNRGTPDGANFKGRGFIQLTGRANYTRFGPDLGTGVDIVNHPDQACDPAIAARLLALFLKDKEDDIRAVLLDGNLPAARRLVNGGHNGQDAFDDALRTGEQIIPAS